MKKIMKAMLASILLAGCGANESKVTINTAEQYAKDHNVLLIDVREQYEYDEGHLEGAILIPLSEVEEEIPTMITDKDQEFILYCRSGNRSGQAKDLLEDLGYTNVIDAGGVLDYEGLLTTK